MKTQVVINIGVPGSGKSTWTRLFVSGCAARGETIVVCSADQSHTDELGNYKFDASKTGMAHSACLNTFINMMGKVHFLVVDNANLSEWERRNYVAIAKKFKCEITFNYFRCETVEQIKKCHLRNIHGVPLSVIAEMALRAEPPIDGDDGTVCYHDV